MTLFVLECIRKLRRFRSWLLGPKTPEWFNNVFEILSGVWGLLHYLIPIELIPSLVAIGTDPRHYFERLPVIIDKKKSMYKAPASLLKEGIAAFTLLVTLVKPRLHLGVEESSIRWELLLFALLSPVIIYVTLTVSIACVLSFGFFLPDGYAESLLTRGHISLRARRYSRKDYGLYSSGMCALSVYLFLVFPIVAAIFWFSWREFAVAFGGWNKLPPIIAEAWLLPASFVGCFLLLTPYSELVRAVTVIPHLEVIDLDVQSLNNILRRRQELPADLVVKLVRVRWVQLKRRMIAEELSALKLGSVSVEFYRLSRAVAYLQFNVFDLDAIAKASWTEGEKQVLTALSGEVSKVSHGVGFSTFWPPPTPEFDGALAVVLEFSKGHYSRAMASRFITKLIHLESEEFLEN